MTSRIFNNGLPRIYQMLFVIVLIAVVCLANFALAGSAPVDTNGENYPALAIDDILTSNTAKMNTAIFGSYYGLWATDKAISGNDDIIPINYWNNKPVQESRNITSSGYVQAVDEEEQIALEDWMLDPAFWDDANCLTVEKQHKNWTISVTIRPYGIETILANALVPEARPELEE